MSAIQSMRIWQRISNYEKFAPPVLIVLLVGILLLSLGGFTDGAWWRMALVLIVAPLTEEVIFRLGMHEALLRRKVSPWIANLLVAIAFGLAHWLARGDATAMLVAAPAVLLGVVYARSRSLALCVLLHSAMNLVWLYTH